MELNLLLILGIMIFCQLLVYVIARRDYFEGTFGLIKVFPRLAMTQIFSIAFLTIFSVFNFFDEPRKFVFTEFIFSLLIFALLLPLLLSGIIAGINSIFRGNAKKLNDQSK